MKYHVTAYIVIKGLTYTLCEKGNPISESFDDYDSACDYAESVYEKIANQNTFIDVSHLENDKWELDALLDYRAWKLIQNERKGK